MTEPRPLTVRNFWSSGISTRFKDEEQQWLTFFSALEYDSYLDAVYMHPGAAVRTQYLLTPADCFKALAKEIGVEPPHFGGNTQTLSTDIVLDYRGTMIPIAVKPKSECELPKIDRLLRLERQYWAKMGWSHRIVTEEDLSGSRRRNLRHANDAAIIARNLDRTRSRHALALLRAAMAVHPELSLKRIFEEVDRRLPPPTGTAATVFWAAVWHHKIDVDLSRRIMPMSPCQSFLR